MARFVGKNESMYLPKGGDRLSGAYQIGLYVP